MMEKNFESHKNVYKEYVESSNIAPFVKKKFLEEKVFSGDFKFYFFYPKLFSSCFEIDDLRKLQRLCLSGFFYYLSLIKMDRIYDSTATFLSVDDYSLASASQEEAIKLLGSLFDPGSAFWHLWNQRKAEYFRALITEKSRAISDKEAYFNLADDKSAFGKAAIDALYIMAGEPFSDVYQKLLLSHRYFSIANQIVDDIQDMISDLEQGQFNWVYRQLVLFLKKNKIDPAPLSHEELNKYLYTSKLALLYYKKAGEFFNKAVECLPKTKPSLWEQVIKDLIKKNRNRTDTLEGFHNVNEARAAIRQKHQQKIKFPDIKVSIPGKGIPSGIGNSIEFIVNEWKAGYADLKHIMYLSEIEGFSATQQVHVGDIFQRAVVTDVLLDLSDMLSINFNEVIRNEIRYLTGQRNQDKIGGWKYFPSVPEIAADIDDLGQLIQLFKKSGDTKTISQYCRGPVEFAIKHGTTGSGGIKTWILPKKNLSDLQQKQQLFNKTKWGEGPDVEVNANFLYSLFLIDAHSYEQPIRSGADYIIREQKPEGFWESRWYYGPYYGTYVCTRMMSTLGNTVEQSATKKALDFLMETQQEEGGWSEMKQPPDALSTSLALITLKMLDRKKAEKAIRKGEKFLLSLRDENHSWPAINFIRPRVNDPYKSKTLTTAYALKALVVP